MILVNIVDAPSANSGSSIIYTPMTIEIQESSGYYFLQPQSAIFRLAMELSLRFPKRSSPATPFYSKTADNVEGDGGAD